MEEANRRPLITRSVDERLHLPSPLVWPAHVITAVHVATGSLPTDRGCNEDLRKVARVPELRTTPVKFSIRVEPQRD